MFLGDRIAVMRDGRIVQLGTPEDILTDPANDYVAQFVQDVDRARVLTAGSVMEPVKALVPVTAGPRAALRVMRDLQTSAVFVIGDGRTFLGVVRDKDVMRQVKASETDLSKVIVHKAGTVTADTQLADLFEASVESDLPVAVLDEKNRLLGVIPRVTLLSALGNIPTDTGELRTVDPVATIPIDVITETLLATARDSVGTRASEKEGAL
jgi:glycine betaine/proline transport system ATP-binding protein